MAASTLVRLTTSGACASCGAYGLSRHSTSCQPAVVRRFKLTAVRGYDSRLSAALRDRAHLEDEALRSV